jgi:cardiolipin synthase
MNKSDGISDSDQKISLIRGGKPYFDLLLALINKAKLIIYIQTYIFDEDETGTEITNALKEASIKRKVAVFLLVDGYASGKLTHEFKVALNQAGIHFQLFEPLLKSKHFYFGRRLHHKIVTVDNLYSLVGGMNISNRYNDMPNQPAWLDWAIYAEGNVSVWLAFICQSRTNKRLLAKAAIVTRNSFQQQGESVVVKINDWVRGKHQITSTYSRMLARANHHIIIMSAYFLPGRMFRNKMRLASKRGVKIQLIVAGKSDISIAKYAERYLYASLIRNGIEIYEYQHTVLHGKLATCDNNWSTVGSYNINGISAYASVELNLEVLDVPFAKTLTGTLTNLILVDCTPIENAMVKQLRPLNKLLHYLSFQTYRLLFFLFTFYFRKRE